MISVRTIRLATACAIAALCAAGPPATAQITDADLQSAILAGRPAAPPGASNVPPWPEWDPTTVSCSSWTSPIPTEVVTECGSEALGFVLQWVDIAAADGPRDRGYETIDAAFATMGLPVSAVRCVVRGIAVHHGNLAGMSEPELEVLRQRIDTLVDIADLIKTARELLLNPSKTPLREKLISPDGAKNAWDARETLALPDRVRRDLTSHAERLASFDAALAEAEAHASECRPGDTETRARQAWQDARDYLEDLGKTAAHGEQRTFCVARAALLGATAEEKIAWSGTLGSLEGARERWRNAAEQFARIDLRLVTIQRRGKQASDRARAFGASVDEAERAISTALASCDEGGLAAQRARLGVLARDPCADATGVGNRIEAARARIDAAAAALADARAAIPRIVAPVQAALAACRPEIAARELAAARGELTRLTAATELHLTACPDFDPSPTATAEGEIAYLSARLDDERREGRRLLGEVRAATESCQFARATELLGQVGADLASCPVAPEACEPGDAYDREACLTTRLLEDRQAADDAAVAREAAYHEASADIFAAGEQLWSWGQEELAKARAEDAGRCAALAQIPAIARDLEGLADPLGCPDPRIAAQRARGAELRAAAAAIDQEIEARRAGLVEGGRRAADRCHLDELIAVLAAFDRLLPALCGKAVPERAELEQARERLARLDGDAATIVAEAEDDLAAWLERCDPVPLGRTEARLANLERCGWDRLDAARQARVRQLIDWGRQAAHVAELAERSRAVGLPIQEAETWVGAAEQRSAAGPTDAQGLAAFGLERDRAAAAMAEADARLAEIEGDPWRSPACTRDAATRRAAVGARFASLRAPATAAPGDAAGWGARPARADEADPCAGPRPAYEAALQTLLAAARGQDMGQLEGAAARVPMDCASDLGTIAALRDRLVALAEAKAKANADRMRSAVAKSAAQRADDAAAWASFESAILGALDAHRRATAPSIGTSPGGGTTAGTRGGGAAPTCMVMPYREQPGTGGGDYQYFVFESAGGAGMRAFQIMKAARKEGGGLGGGATMRGPYPSLGAAQGALDRLCPPSQRATAPFP